MLVRSSRGPNSGKPHQTTLVCIEDDDRRIVAGTNWGQPDHPDWTVDLLANPQCTMASVPVIHQVVWTPRPPLRERTQPPTVNRRPVIITGRMASLWIPTPGASG
jgi:F420H(2)-dependent quinone reductase